MADRFPSIEDIDDDQGNTHFDGGADGGDFLSRERAALGDDADQFQTGQNVPSLSVQDGGFDDDLLGGGGDANGEVNQFQSNFPAIDTGNERVGPGGTITGAGPRSAAIPDRGVSPAPSSFAAGSMEEPEVVKEWRAERDAQISKREEAAAARKESTIKDAQEAIDDFYQNYNQKREKGLAQTKREAEEFLAKREDTSSGGTSWERIAKLVEVKGKGGAAPGKEHFKRLLADLSKDAEAPGSKGY